MIEHPARGRLLREAASRRVVDRLVDAVPSDGWALGLAIVWPQPALQERVGHLALELWRSELRDEGLEADGPEPLIEALQQRALALRRGRTSAAPGTRRLAMLLEAVAAALASSTR